MAEIFKGKTKSGFGFEISRENFDDYELFEYISEVDEKPQIAPKIVAKLLGNEQKNALLNHVRLDTGRVPIDAVIDELKDIMNSSAEAKNS